MKALLFVFVLAYIGTAFAAEPTPSIPTNPLPNPPLPTILYPTLPPQNGGTHADIPSTCSTAWCDLSALFNGSVPGAGNDVTLKSTIVGEVKVLISSDLSVNSLSILSSTSGTASIRVAVGTALKIANGLNITAGAALEVLGYIETKGSVLVSGSLNITGSASAAFLGGLNLTAGALLTCDSSTVLIANATHSLDGAIRALNNAFIDIRNSKTNLTGSIDLDATASFFVSSGELDVAVSASVVGTITLDGAAKLSSSGGPASLDSIVVSGAGNLFASADNYGWISVGSGLSVVEGGELTILARADVNSTLWVSGKLTVNANVTVNAGGSLNGSVVVWGQSTLFSIGHAPTNVSGNVTFIGGAVFELRNVTAGIIAGCLVGDYRNLSRVFLNGSHVTFTPDAVINATVELNRTYVNTTGNSISFRDVIVSGPNSTVEAPPYNYTEFRSVLRVAVNASLLLIGNVITRGNVTVNGSLWVSPSSSSWSPSSVNVTAGFTLDAAANFTLLPWSYALIQSDASLNGTVQLYDNSTLHAQGSLTAVSWLAVLGANATVKSTAGGLVHLVNNVTVAAGASLAFYGNATVDAVTIAWGGIHVGVNGSISATDSTLVNFTAPFSVGGEFYVNAQAEVQFWAGAWINGSSSLAKNSTLRIVRGFVFFAWSVVASGTTVVNDTLSVGDTGIYNHTDGALVISHGAIWASQIYIGGNTSTSAGAWLRGAGTIYADVQVSGTAAVGFSPGVMDVVGDYVLTSTSNTELDIASATSYDQINVTGDAVIAGTLSIKLLGDYIPTDGTSFPFLFYDSASGSFASIVQASTGKFTEVDAATVTSVDFAASPNTPTNSPTPSISPSVGPTKSPVPSSGVVVSGSVIMIVVSVITMVMLL